jgi:hypothetical protein
VSGTFVPLFPLPATSNWRKESSLASARKLLALQPHWLAVGHGRTLREPQAAMERAIHVMERDLARENGRQAKLV